MMRKTLLLLPVLLVGLVLYMLLGTGTGSEPVDPADSVGREPAGASPSLPVAGGEVPVQPGDAAERTELEGTGPASLPGSPLRVRVTRKRTGEPVPGARVSFFEGRPLTQLSGELRGEYERRNRDDEWLALELGRTVFTDAEGLALVPVEDRVTITGRHGQLYGAISVNRLPNRPPSDEQALELERDLAFKVQVLDARGDPAADVDVGVVRVYPEGDPRNPAAVGLVGLTTGADGLASVTHAQRWFQSQRQDPQPIGYVLRPRIPGLIEGGVDLDPERPPEGTVVLHLPPTGQVVVGVADARGRVLPQLPFPLVRLSLAPEEPLPEGVPYDPPSAHEWGNSAQASPTVTYPRVVAGRAYHAKASTRKGWVEEVFMGPLEQDWEVRVNLRMEAEHYAITGRILDGEREPLSGAQVRVSYETADGRGGASFRTDEGGSFWSFLEPTDKDTTLATLAFEHRPPESGERVPPWRTVIEDGRPLLRGTNDLGDVILRPVEFPVLARGRILVDGDVPEERLGGFGISAWHPGDTGTGRNGTGRNGTGRNGSWRRESDLGLTLEEGGRFRIQGTGRASRYRLEHIDPYRTPIFLPLEPIEFAPGTEDLLVELETAASMEVVVLTEEAVPVDDLWVRLVPADGQVPEANARAQKTYFGSNRLYARGVSSSEGRHGFRWGALWAGGYVLEVLPRAGRAPVVAIAIQIARGSKEGPRVAEIDLRGRLREIAVTVTDPAGSPLDRPLILVQEPAPDVAAEGYSPERGTSRILTAEPYVDLLVVARGYAFRSIPGVTGDMRVVLEPLPEVVVKIGGELPKLPDRRNLSVSIRSENSRTRGLRVSTDYVGGSLEGWRPGPVEFQPEDEVTMQVEREGRQTITLSVVDDRTGEAYPIHGIEPREFDVLPSASPQVVEIRIPQEGLTEALRRADGR